MGDEKDPSATSASEPAASVPPAPVSVVPRPVSVVPRPAGSATPLSRMPPAPSSRGIGPGASVPAPPPLPARAAPPPPPLRASLPEPRPAPTAPPPPPPLRHSPPPMAPRTATQPPSLSASAQLEQRLGAVQLELRKLGSERHTLRARLRREADRLLELESALRAEKELRRHAAEEHQAALAGMRSRASETELAKDAEIARLNGELARLAAELESARVPAAIPSKPTAKAPQGLRRIRGIGPAYQRVLEQLGVTRVEQIAAWTASDVATFAEKLKIRTDRITKDDWVGQAQRLGPELE